MTESPTRTVPGWMTRQLTPPHAQVTAFASVHEPQGVAAESGCELGAAPVWFGRDLHDGIAESQLGAGGQRLVTDVQVRVDLIAGERPAFDRSDDDGGRTRAHDGELSIRVRPAIG